MDWLRWYHGTTTDPKFQVIARRTGQNVAAVVAVWAMLLERASDAANATERNRTQPNTANAHERGSVFGFDCEGADVVLGLEDGAACSIVEAMKEKGLISGERIAKWENRQPKREDGSAERAKAWREKQAANATERNRTQPNAILEKSREDTKNKNHTTPHAGGDSVLTSPENPRTAEKRKASAERASYPEDFEQFWRAYPNPKNKKAAHAEWARAKDKPPMPEIMAALERAKKTPQWRKDGGKYVPYPERWIKRGCWDDEPARQAYDPSTDQYAAV